MVCLPYTKMSAKQLISVATKAREDICRRCRQVDRDSLRRAQLEKRAKEIPEDTAHEMYNNFLQSPPPKPQLIMKETLKQHLAETREMMVIAYTVFVQKIKAHSVMELHW